LSGRHQSRRAAADNGYADFLHFVFLPPEKFAAALRSPSAVSFFSITIFPPGRNLARIFIAENSPPVNLSVSFINAIMILF